MSSSSLPSNPRVLKCLTAAIETMRNACEEATREAKDGNEEAVQRVTKSLCWGIANASSSLESAMGALQDASQIREMLLQERVKELEADLASVRAQLHAPSGDRR